MKYYGSIDIMSYKISILDSIPEYIKNNTIFGWLNGGLYAKWYTPKGIVATIAPMIIDVILPLPLPPSGWIKDSKVIPRITQHITTSAIDVGNVCAKTFNKIIVSKEIEYWTM